MNMAASASYRAAADPPERDDDELARGLPDGYGTWDEYFDDQLDAPTEADWAAEGRARNAADAAD